MAFCLTTLINTVSCDVRDTDGDRHAAVLHPCFMFRGKSHRIVFVRIGIINQRYGDNRFLIRQCGDAGIYSIYVNSCCTGVVAMPIYVKRIKLPKSLSEPLIDTQQIVCGISLIALSLNI